MFSNSIAASLMRRLLAKLFDGRRRRKSPYQRRGNDHDGIEQQLRQQPAFSAARQQRIGRRRRRCGDEGRDGRRQPRLQHGEHKMAVTPGMPITTPPLATANAIRKWGRPPDYAPSSSRQAQSS